MGVDPIDAAGRISMRLNNPGTRRKRLLFIQLLFVPVFLLQLKSRQILHEK
jgi:hypothetical protein